MIAIPEESLSAFVASTYAPLKQLAATSRQDYGEIVGKFDRWRVAEKLTVGISAIAAEEVGQYLTWLVEVDGQQASTAAKHARTIRCVMREAKRKGRTTIDPGELPRPRAVKRAPRAWTYDEWWKLLEVARAVPGLIGAHRAADWWEALLMVCLSTGWRIGAVMRLRWVDVTWATRKAVSTETKNRAEKVATLRDDAVGALMRIYVPRAEFVFGDWPYDRHCRQWQALQRHLGWMIDRAGIRPLGKFHIIRKCGSTWIRNAAGLTAAAEFAGHADQRTTDAHYVDRTQDTGLKPIDGLPCAPCRQLFEVDALDWL